MSTFADLFRPYWVPGLNNVSGKRVKEIPGWICDEDYQIYSAVTSSTFNLNIFDDSAMLEAYAAEISRISAAAFETIERIDSAKSNKSIAWAFIQRYYAAFFAAHALMRMFGLGCVGIGKPQTTSILRVAAAWGVASPKSMSGGLYSFSFDSGAMQFSGQVLTASPHEGFWRLFDSRVKSLRDDILAPHLTSTVDVVSRQTAAVLLAQLRENLSHLNGGSQPTWLTQMRNSINYDHKWSTWWPYSDRPKYYDLIQAAASDWKKDALEIDLSGYPDEELLRFQASCNFILALCRENLTDLSARCSSGKSFLHFGSVAYLSYSKLLQSNYQAT